MGKKKAKATIPPLSKGKMTREPLLLEQDQEEGEPELDEEEEEEEEEDQEEELEEESGVEEEERLQLEFEISRPTSIQLGPEVKSKVKGKRPIHSSSEQTSLPQRRSKRLQSAPHSPPRIPNSTKSARQVASRFSLPTSTRPSRSITASGSGSGSSLSLNLTPTLTQSSSSRRSTRLSTPTTAMPMNTDLDRTPPHPCLPFLKVEPVTSISDLRTRS